MATAESINSVANIIASDKDRRFVVVSAAGKRFKSDEKITDILYACHKEAAEIGVCKSFVKVKDRYDTLKKELGLSIDLEPIYNEIEYRITKETLPDYAASRGEYLSALLIAEKLNYEFIDAETIIKFSDDGTFDAEYTNDIASMLLKDKNNAVIPGFYGAMPNGQIRVFSRGGSDVSGAIVARAVNADVYENWTDVNGFMMADPRIVENPKNIKTLSYKELRELAYMGANVLHPESIFPLKAAGIPINIKNTFEPDNKGTMIMPKTNGNGSEVITGIAGTKGFTAIFIEKSMMNNELGFCRKLLSCIEQLGINIEHMPTGIDTTSVVIHDAELEGKLDILLERIEDAVHPDNIEVFKNLALVATVGHGMSYKAGTAGRLFSALAKAKVNIRMIDQGSSELNIIIGVECADYERAIKAIYEEFVK